VAKQELFLLLGEKYIMSGLCVFVPVCVFVFSFFSPF